MTRQRHPTRREVLKAAGTAAAAAGVSAEDQQPRSEPWFRRCLVGIEIGPTGANDRDRLYMSRATGKDWVEKLVRAQCEYGVVFMKDMEFAYYDSRAARKCPNLGSRDLLRETLDAAKPHRMPIVAYCQVQYDDSSWRTHPEWRMKGWDGSDLGGRLCYNSGYIDFIKSVLSEMMEYEIAGFHVDMLDYGFGPPVGCWCPACRSAFRQVYGSEMPTGETWDEAWERVLAFRAESNTRFCKRIHEFVRARRPELSVDFNYHGYPPFSWYPGQLPAKHAANGDFVTAEGLPWIFGHNNPSLLSLFMSGARPEGPVQGVTSRGVFDYHDFTVRPAAEMKWEVMTYLAHGAQCTIVDKLYYDGSTEPVAYERIGQVFGEARRKRAFFGHPADPEVGIYYSARSRDWWGRADPPKYMRAFWGAHLAMLHSHITMGVLLDETVSSERLSAYPVVWLPGVTILSDRERALLERYVTDGGALLLTGLAGICDRFGQVQDRSTIEGLIGARLVRCETVHPDNYVRLPLGALGGWDALGRDLPRGWAMLVDGPIVFYQPTTGVPIGEAMPAVRSQNNQWSWHMSAGASAGPAAIANRIGKGVVLTIACSIDAAYVSDYRMPEHRTLMRNAVRALNPKPKVEIDASPHVEAVVTRDESRHRLLIHFVAWSAPPTFSSAAFPNGKRVLPPIMEAAQAYEAGIELGVRISGVRASSRTTRIDRRGTRIALRVGEIHEVVVLDLA